MLQITKIPPKNFEICPRGLCKGSIFLEIFFLKVLVFTYYLLHILFQALLTCSSKDLGQTKLNDKSVPFQGILVLNHKDVFTIGDRKFRWEYPDDSPHLVVSTPKKKSSKSPAKVNGGNGNGNGVSGKGETYATMTPKAKAKAAAEAMADTPAHVSHSKRVSFGPYVSPEYIGMGLFTLSLLYIVIFFVQ